MFFAYRLEVLWRNQQMPENIIQNILPLDTVQMIHLNINMPTLGP